MRIHQNCIYSFRLIHCTISLDRSSTSTNTRLHLHQQLCGNTISVELSPMNEGTGQQTAFSEPRAASHCSTATCITIARVTKTTLSIASEALLATAVNDRHLRRTSLIFCATAGVNRCPDSRASAWRQGPEGRFLIHPGAGEVRELTESGRHLANKQSQTFLFLTHTQTSVLLGVSKHKDLKAG